MILLLLILGIAILLGTGIVFFKWPVKIYYLFILLLGLLISNLFIGNDSLHLIISFIVIGSTAGFILRNNKKFQTFLFISTLSISLISASNYYYLKNFRNIDILQNSKQDFISVINKNEIPDSEKNEINQRLDETITIISDMVFFVYFLNSLLMSLICFYPVKFILFRFFRKGDDYNWIIEEFRLKEYLIFIFIAGWLIVLLVDRKNYFIYTTGLNISLILSCFYLIQAFGIIKFIFKKKNFPFFFIPVVLLVFLFIGVEYLFFVLIILSSIGILDFWLDFRKLNLNKK